MLKPIDSLTVDDVTSLVTNRVPEGRSIDYKEELPAATSGEKKEFLGDVSSFANAVGGWILYGIAEERDEAGKPTGIPKDCTGLTGNPDAVVLRCDSMARDGIDPRIQGLRWRAVPVSHSAFVLACWVPRSLRAPHMVVFEGASKFWARGASGKYRLDVQQLREAFVASESLRQSIRAFRLDRTARIAGDDTPLPLRVGPRAILHVIPLGTFDSAAESPTSLELAHVVQGGLFGFARLTSRYNFDGLVGYREGKSSAYDYVQLFRNGVVEYVRPFGPLMRPDSGFLPSKSIEQELAQQLEMCLRDLGTWGVEGPLIVVLSCVGVKGWRMGLPQDLELMGDPGPIDRDTLPLPEVWLEQIPASLSFQAAAQILHGPFDALWQSAGWEGSPYFNPDGSWGRYGLT